MNEDRRNLFGGPVKAECGCVLDRLMTVIEVRAPSGTVTDPMPLSAGIKDQPVCPIHGHPFRIPDPSGIYFHPVRKRWIVLYSLRYDPGPSTQIDSQERVLRLGNCRFEFSAPVDFVNRDHLCYDRAPVFRNEVVDRTAPDKSMLVEFRPVLVIKPEYLDLVNLTQLAVPQLVEGKWVFRAKLRDWSSCNDEAVVARDIDHTVHFNESQFDDLTKVHAEVWPDLPFKEWNRFWLAVETEVSNTKGYQYQVFSTTGRPLLQDWQSLDKDASYHSMQGRPRLLFLHQGSKAGGGFVALDCATKSASDNGGEDSKKLALAIDFGTARTAIGIPALAGEVGEIVSDMGADGGSTGISMGFRHIGHPIVEAVLPRHRNLTPWFPTRSAGPSRRATRRDTIIGVLPSMIFYAPTPDECPFSFNAQQRPIEDFTIPDPDVMIGSNQALGLETNLKWRTDGAGKAARNHYIESSMLLAIAQALDHNPMPSYQIRYSFPQAFSEQQARELTVVFANAAKSIEGISGVRVEALPSGIDESTCGIRATRSKFHTPWVLTLDLGGGTLDLCLWAGSSDGEVAASPVATDSLFFGADILPNNWIKHVAPVEVPSYLQSRIYQKHWTGIIEEAANDPQLKSGLSRAYKGVRAFFAALQEYVARFLAGSIMGSACDGKAVAAVFLGSGWRGFEADPGLGPRIQDFAAELCAGIEKRIQATVKQTVQVNPISAAIMSGHEKAAVVVGLLHLPAGSPPSAIRSPNGLDEEVTGGDRVAWTRVAGPGPDAEKFPLMSRPTNSPPLPKVLTEEYLPWLSNPRAEEHGRWLSFRNCIGGGGEDGVKIRFGRLNDLYKYFLGPAIGPQPAPRKE